MLEFWFLFRVLLTFAAVLLTWSRRDGEGGDQEWPSAGIVMARVDLLGPAESSYGHDMAVVLSTPDGSIGRQIVPGLRLSCRVGDAVQAVNQGVLLTLTPGECRQQSDGSHAPIHPPLPRRPSPPMLAGGALACVAAGYGAAQVARPAAKGYVVAEISVTDPAAYETYKPKAAAVIARYGGRYLVRGGAVTPLEGAAPSGRIILLEFDSAAQARAFNDGADYAAVRPIRQRAAQSRVFVVEGVAP